MNLLNTVTVLMSSIDVFFFYQLSKALRTAEAKRPSLKGKPLAESDYMDVIETVCDKSWDE